MSLERNKIIKRKDLVELRNKYVLHVEDNIDLAHTVIDYLELRGVVCDHAINGMVALQLIKSNDYDLIILDVNLPLLSGYKVCERLRAEGVDLPILMLTSNADLREKLKGFNVGADDYLVKPFAIEELIARAVVLLKRRNGMTRVKHVCDLVFDMTNRQVIRSGKNIKLSPTGFNILKVMIMASPLPVSRNKIIREVWGDMPPDSNSLKVHIFKLRKSINDGFCDNLIHTIPNYGYSIK